MLIYGSLCAYTILFNLTPTHFTLSMSVKIPCPAALWGNANGISVKYMSNCSFTVQSILPSKF